MEQTIPHNENTKICIGLCVKNSEKGLVYVTNNLQKILDTYPNTIIIFAFDDSRDRSVELMSDFKNKNSDNVVILKSQKEVTQGKKREELISDARNCILGYIREYHSDYEYFAMMDSNEYACIGDINIDVLKYYLSKSDEWDGLSFHREAGDYDTWAISFDPYIFSFYHFIECRRCLENMRDAYNKLIDNSIRKDLLLKVWSAFNGFAIYKIQMFIDCSYSAKINMNYVPKDILVKQMRQDGILKPGFVNINDCEHRHFHFEAIKKHDARIMIAPRSLFKKMENPPPNLRGPA
jgi:hypothetical protein